MCPLENQSSAKRLAAKFGARKVTNKEKRAYKRNQRKKRKYLLHQSILSQAYIFISFKIFD
jgi:hypothetical protein